MDLVDDTRLEAENAELRARIYELMDIIQLKEIGILGQCAVAECPGWWEMAPVPLCDGHLATAARDYQERILKPLLYGDTPEAVDQTKSTPAVYYIRFGDLVKIGTTTNLKSRLRAFCAFEDQLLAVEPGGYEQERKRHRQFADLRVPRTELFRTDARLTAHIGSARDAFGDPKAFM